MSAERRPSATRHGRSRAGAEHEDFARRWLEARGLRTLATNYTCRGGEIDLVMRDGDVVVFVEVRYRRHDRYGSAAETVDHRKQRRLHLAAQHFLMRHSEVAENACRFDVMALGGDSKKPTVNWIENAFSA